MNLLKRARGLYYSYLNAYGFVLLGSVRFTNPNAEV